MLLIKALIGALIVVLLSIAAGSRKYVFLAGLIPLFPTFALIGQFITYREQGAEKVKEVADFGIWSLIPYFVYLLVVKLTVTKVGFYRSTALVVGAWTVVSVVLIRLHLRGAL